MWSCGLMDKASDFGSEGCRFESCHDREKSAAFITVQVNFFFKMLAIVRQRLEFQVI